LQNLLEENMKLRLALQRTAEEGERALEETQTAFHVKIHRMEKILSEKEAPKPQPDANQHEQEYLRMKSRLKLAEDAAEDAGERCRRLSVSLARANNDGANREAHLAAKLAAAQAEADEASAGRSRAQDDARNERERTQLLEARMRYLTSFKY